MAKVVPSLTWTLNATGTQQVIVPGGALTKGDNEHTYVASCTVPANVTTNPVVYDVVISVNGKVESSLTKQVTVEAAAEAPEYINVESSAVTPNSLPASGGNVQITVNLENTPGG